MHGQIRGQLRNGSIPFTPRGRSYLNFLKNLEGVVLVSSWKTRLRCLSEICKTLQISRIRIALSAITSSLASFIRDSLNTLLGNDFPRSGLHLLHSRNPCLMAVVLSLKKTTFSLFGVLEGQSLLQNIFVVLTP